MTLSDQMNQLTQHLLETHGDRAATVVNIREHTARELAGFRAGRQTMAVEQRRRLREGMDALQGHVEALRGESKSFLKDLDTAHRAMAVAQGEQLATARTELASDVAAFLTEAETRHQAMAAAQRQQLRRQMEALQDDVDGLRCEAAAFLQELDTAHQAMAAKQREQLLAENAQFVSEVAAFLKESNADHQAMAAAQRQRLSQQMETLQHRVDRLRREANAFLQELDTAHQAMAAKQHEQLLAERSRLTSEVGLLRDRLQAEQATLQADQSKARQIWRDYNRLIKQRQPSQPSPMPPLAEEITSPATAQMPVEEGDNDLTLIRGIGANMRRRLNRAGITTFAQLAQSTPGELRQSLGGMSKLFRMEEWIEQARAMVKSA